MTPQRQKKTPEVGDFDVTPLRACVNEHRLRKHECSPRWIIERAFSPPRIGFRQRYVKHDEAAYVYSVGTKQQIPHYQGLVHRAEADAIRLAAQPPIDLQRTQPVLKPQPFGRPNPHEP
jgi:hypothetical protein